MGFGWEEFRSMMEFVIRTRYEKEMQIRQELKKERDTTRFQINIFLSSALAQFVNALGSGMSMGVWAYGRDEYHKYEPARAATRQAIQYGPTSVCKNKEDVLELKKLETAAMGVYCGL